MTEQRGPVEHTVSVFPVYVDPTEDDPRAYGWRYACSCTRRRSRNYLIRMDRAGAEKDAAGHLKLFDVPPGHPGWSEP